MMSNPYRVLIRYDAMTQGSALGWYVPPLWGENTRFPNINSSGNDFAIALRFPSALEPTRGFWCRIAGLEGMAHESQVAGDGADSPAAPGVSQRRRRIGSL